VPKVTLSRGMAGAKKLQMLEVFIRDAECYLWLSEKFTHFKDADYTRHLRQQVIDQINESLTWHSFDHNNNNNRVREEERPLENEEAEDSEELFSPPPPPPPGKGFKAVRSLASAASLSSSPSPLAKDTPTSEPPTDLFSVSLAELAREDAEEKK